MTYQYITNIISSIKTYSNQFTVCHQNKKFMELQETLNLVKTNWKQQGLNLIELRSKDKLIKILSKFNILASEEFMEVYSIINGFDENDMDSEGLSFWPIEKILRGNKPNDEYIYFADFLINSHWYGYKINGQIIQ